jgi:uncharacterized membrane protein
MSGCSNRDDAVSITQILKNLSPKTALGSVVGTEQIGLGKSRLESLSDGIFAFAMTLLILGLGIPIASTTVSTMTVGQYLASLFPDIIHYVIAFLILASFWMSHHMQSHHIKMVDRIFLWLNILALMFLVLIPFSSDLAGNFPNDRLAALFFEMNLLLVGVIFHVQWRYATTNHRLVEKDLNETYVQGGRRVTLIIPLFSVAGILLALANVPFSAGIYFFVPLVFLIRYIGPFKTEF